MVQAVDEFDARRAYGVEYAASRHLLAQRRLRRKAASFDVLSNGRRASLKARVKLLQGDCADGGIWREHLRGCTRAYASNLLFDAELNERLRQCIEAAPSLRVVACLKAWPDGLKGLGEPHEVRCETSWSAPLVLIDKDGQRPMPHEGTPVHVYNRLDEQQQQQSQPEGEDASDGERSEE